MPNIYVLMYFAMEQYRKVCRKRLMATVKKDRFVIETDTVKAHRSIVLKTGEAKRNAEGKGGDSKMRQKMPEEELREHIFNMFEKQAFWKLKELNAELHQPEGHLKKMLDELCIHHRKGEHKTQFELKEEYKSSAAVTLE